MRSWFVELFRACQVYDPFISVFAFLVVFGVPNGFVSVVASTMFMFFAVLTATYNVFPFGVNERTGYFIYGNIRFTCGLLHIVPASVLYQAVFAS